MEEMIFNLHHPNTSDDQFWDQLKQLDDLQDRLPDFSGFSIKAMMSTGKEFSVPFVRFSRNLPKKKS